MLIRAEDSALVVIGLKERLIPAMQAPARTLKNASQLPGAAQVCAVPSILTEQYPEGLGATAPEIITAAGSSPVIEKLHFPAWKDGEFSRVFRSRVAGRRC